MLKGLSGAEVLFLSMFDRCHAFCLCFSARQTFVWSNRPAYLVSARNFKWTMSLLVRLLLHEKIRTPDERGNESLSRIIDHCILQPFKYFQSLDMNADNQQ